MAGKGWIWTFVGLFAFSGGCQIVGDLEPELVLGTGGEVCGDGVDDDGDGLTDCADPDCGVGSCVPNTPPPGWEGPFLVRRAPWDGTSGPSCPEGLEGSAHYMSPAPAACTPCTCGGVVGGECSPPELRCWPSADCTGNTNNATINDVGDCQEPFGLQQPTVVSCRIVGPGEVKSNGTCTASGGAPAGPKLFEEIVSACKLAGGAGCAEGSSCVPPLEGGARVCVRASGDTTCPSGWDAEALTAHSSGQDARSCTACSCQTQGGDGVCEGGVYRAFDRENCLAGDADPPIDITGDACFNLSILADGGSFSLRAVSGGTLTGGCQPNGGMAFGAVVPLGPVKYCCR